MRAAMPSQYFEFIGGYNFFPNVMFYPLPGYGIILEVRPVAVDQSDVVLTYFGIPPEDDKEREEIDARLAFYEPVFKEDFFLLPGIQKSLNSGAISDMTLGFLERAIRHFHETLDTIMAEESDA